MKFLNFIARIAREKFMGCPWFWSCLFSGILGVFFWWSYYNSGKYTKSSWNILSRILEKQFLLLDQSLCLFDLDAGWYRVDNLFKLGLNKKVIFVNGDWLVCVAGTKAINGGWIRVRVRSAIQAVFGRLLFHC